jgi:hypothetical protein
MTTLTPATSRLRTAAGLLGIVAVVVMIPSIVVGTPDTPGSSEAATAYYEQASLFVTVNGFLPMLQVLSFLLFLGALAAIVRAEAPEAAMARYSVLTGGVAFLVLSAAGWAAELVYPATVLRFQDAALDAQHGAVFLTLAVWLYHFCQIGAAVMIIGGSLLALRSQVFPRWFAYLSWVAALGAVLHTWLGGWAAYISLAWVLIAAVLLLVGSRNGARPVAS